ncbi:Membrane-spanning 4-domains subfamily A member 4D, partial [Ophiophagus hannah]
MDAQPVVTTAGSLSYITQTDFPVPLKKFYRGEPLALGNIGIGILTILTLFTALEFCITISVASFGCKMLCRDTFPETVVVIYQNVSPASAEQDPPLDCKQAAIQP